MKSACDVSLKTRTALVVSALFEAEKKASLSAEAITLAAAMADNIATKLQLLHGAIIRVAATVPARALKDANTAQVFESH